MKKKNFNLEKVGCDLVNIKFKEADTLKQVMEKFYLVMRKHGIKRGTKSKSGGIIQDNYEWTFSKALFQERVIDYFQMANIFDKLPKDLESY